MNADRFYIGGAWVAPLGTATMPIMDPSMDEQVGTVALGSLPDVDRAVRAANEAFEEFGRWPKSDRLALLKRVREGTAARMKTSRRR
jgi:aldehyde dehydrogenase (NAD+)